MMENGPACQCANCDTLVEKTGTDRCPTCSKVFFYPVATSVADSEGSGSIRVEDFDVDAILEDKGDGAEEETGTEDAMTEE